MNKPALIFLTIFVSIGSLYAADKSLWQKLAKDGIHDPNSPAIGILQEPAEALSLLPPDNTGNKVLWVKALQDEYIEPRSTLFPSTFVEVLDMDIIFDNTGEMPLVRFPHAPHTEWLDCKNCHDVIFKKKFRGTPINMFAILNGEFCGRCHGAVAFPLTECNRCHSVPRNTFTGTPGPQPND